MLHMYDNGGHPILGDEMGLGKTLQTISFIAALTYERILKGPTLVVVPMSVMSSWMTEFRRWCATLHVVAVIMTIITLTTLITLVTLILLIKVSHPACAASAH
jgi:SWI/SNF-related matrix-associated actin-dependent regulator of chromatin subfamily A member 5